MASVLCGVSILRDKRPPWFHAALSLLFGLFISSLAIFGGGVFHPADWPRRIPEQWDSFMIALGPSIALTTIVVVVVVVLFRERLKKHLSRHERRALRQRERQTSWQRIRWLHLFGSSALIVCLTASLVCLHAARVSSVDTEVVSDYSLAYHSNPGNPSLTTPQRRAAPPRPLLDITMAAAILSPLCVLGLLASGGWLAFTMNRWRGYIRVRPRHRRDLLARHRSPANAP
jgi:hypothetical protein